MFQKFQSLVYFPCDKYIKPVEPFWGMGERKNQGLQTPKVQAWNVPEIFERMTEQLLHTIFFVNVSTSLSDRALWL